MRPTPKQIKKGLSEDRNGWKPPITTPTPPRVDKQTRTARRGD